MRIARGKTRMQIHQSSKSKQFHPVKLYKPNWINPSWDGLLFVSVSLNMCTNNFIQLIFNIFVHYSSLVLFTYLRTTHGAGFHF
jgi:hypothetical protein